MENTPKTADQINSPQTGQVDVRENEPPIGWMLKRIARLEADLAICRSVLSEIRSMECSDYDHRFSGCCLDDATETADQTLKQLDNQPTNQPTD